VKKISKPAKQYQVPYRLTTKDGVTLTFGSLLEARAALVRAGGGRLYPLKTKDR